MLSARDLAFVGCRLLSLYVLYGVVVMVMFNAADLLQLLASPQEIGWQPNTYVLRTAALLFANLVVFLVLWFASGWVAAKVAADTAQVTEGEATGWSRGTILSLGIIVLGLWILAHHLPTLLSYIPLVLQSDTDSIGSRYLVAALLATALGVYFVLGSRGIAEFIGRLRRW